MLKFCEYPDAYYDPKNPVYRHEPSIPELRGIAEVLIDDEYDVFAIQTVWRTPRGNLVLWRRSIR